MIPKFRAWHKEFKQMREVQELRLDYLPEGNVLACVGNKNIPHRFDIVWGFNEIELMQWTGLQDRNGRDIYADDLIEYNDRIYLVPCVTPVSRHHDAECVNGHKEICDDWTSWSNDCYEIIGNLYENPELLENEKENES